jgi:hypothetical protein
MGGIFLGAGLFVGANSQFPDSQILQYSQVQLGTTLSNIPGFSWSLQASTMYGIIGFFDSTKATATGSALLSMNYSASVTSLAQGLSGTPNGTLTWRGNNANNSGLNIGPAAGTPVGNHLSAFYSAFLITNAAGTLRMAASASLAGDLTINPGTWFTVYLPTPVGTAA